MTRILKGRVFRGCSMSQRASLLVLTILLLGTAPLSGTMIDESSTSELPQDNTVQRIEISADPDSIRDLGESNVIEGFERTRSNTAESSIGVYTEIGFIPSVHIPSSLTVTRADLVIVIVNGEVGIWDARISIEESANVEIRTTIPPSGFLVQGDEKEISKLAEIDVIEAVHNVPTGILVDPILRVVDEGKIMVEILVGRMMSYRGILSQVLVLMHL